LHLGALLTNYVKTTHVTCVTERWYHGTLMVLQFNL